MNDILQMLTAFGVGSIVATAFQFFLSNRAAEKKHIYYERKEAYIGLIESWKRQDIEGHNPDTIRDVAHWQLRCELVASSSVYEKLLLWDETTGTDARPAITKALKKAMRKDLSRLYT